MLRFGFLPGYPVVGEFLIMGAVNTPYQGAMFPLKITFQVTETVDFMNMLFHIFIYFIFDVAVERVPFSVPGRCLQLPCLCCQFVDKYGWI